MGSTRRAGHEYPAFQTKHKHRCLREPCTGARLSCRLALHFFGTERVSLASHVGVSMLWAQFAGVKAPFPGTQIRLSDQPCSQVLFWSGLATVSGGSFVGLAVQVAASPRSRKVVSLGCMLPQNPGSRFQVPHARFQIPGPRFEGAR